MATPCQNPMSAFAAIATSEADFPLSTTSGQSESVEPTIMNEEPQ